MSSRTGSRSGSSSLLSGEPPASLDRLSVARQKPMLTLARWLAAATSTEPARVAAGPVRCDRSGQLERHGVRYRAVDPRDGQRKRCYETVSATSLEEAKKELDYILKQIEKGVWRPPATEQPETPKAEPSFHEYASAWVERRSHEVDARTVEYWQWALSSHL